MFLILFMYQFENSVRFQLSKVKVNQNSVMMTIASGYCMDRNVEDRSRQQKNGWMESEGGEEK